MINDENRTGYQALFFAFIIGVLVFLGMYITWAMAAYIGIVLVLTMLVFTIPPLFWLTLFGTAILGGYYINNNVYPLV